MIRQIEIYEKVLKLLYLEKPQNFVYDCKINKIGGLFFIYLTLTNKHMLNDWDLREHERVTISRFGKHAGISTKHIVVVYDWV